MNTCAIAFVLVVASLFACRVICKRQMMREQKWKDGTWKSSIPRWKPEDLPEELQKLKPLYEEFGYPLIAHQEDLYVPTFAASTAYGIYGSMKAAVVYNPGCLNGANWRVCGLDETGKYQTFSMNTFVTKEDAIKFCCESGYDFEVYDKEVCFKTLSEKNN